MDIAAAVTFGLIAVSLFVFIVLLDPHRTPFSSPTDRFTDALSQGKGRLVRIKHGIIWWNTTGPTYEPGEKICLLVDSRTVGEPFHEKSRSRVDASTVKSAVHASAVHAALACGGDHFVQLAFDEKIVWVETQAEGIEFL